MTALVMIPVRVATAHWREHRLRRWVAEHRETLHKIAWTLAVLCLVLVVI